MRHNFPSCETHAVMDQYGRESFRMTSMHARKQETDNGLQQDSRPSSMDMGNAPVQLELQQSLCRGASNLSAQSESKNATHQSPFANLPEVPTVCSSNLKGSAQEFSNPPTRERIREVPQVEASSGTICNHLKTPFSFVRPCSLHLFDTSTL
jgi:hypothetical protein